MDARIGARVAITQRSRNPQGRAALLALALGLAAFQVGCRPTDGPSPASEQSPATAATVEEPPPLPPEPAPLDPELAGDADALLTRAAELAAQERHVEAARLLRAGLSTIPTERRGAVQFATARYYHEVGLWKSVVEYADQALAGGLESAEALYLAGDGRRRQEELDAAAPLLERAHKADPSFMEATIALASLRRLQDGPEPSLALLEPYFEDPSDGDLAKRFATHRDAVLEYARALSAARRRPEAVDRLVELLARDPYHCDAYADLAKAYFRLRRKGLGQLAQAILNALEESSLDVQRVERMQKVGAIAFARTQRGLNRMRAKRYREAYDDLRGALDMDRSDARVSVQFAEFCLRFHRLEEASTELARSIEAGSQPASGVHWIAARVFLERGLPKEALNAARQALEALIDEAQSGGDARGQAPAFSLALVESRAALETGQLDGAREALERAAKLEPRRWEIPYWLGRIELAAGEPKLALEHFGAAFGENSSRFTELVYYNGVALQRAGRTQKAIQQLEQVTRREPHYNEAFEELLNILVLSKEEGHAAKRQEIEEALARVAESQQQARELRKRIDRTPMAEAGNLYRDLGAAELRLGKPGSHDLLFLAAGLEPQDPVVLRYIVPFLRRHEDSFIRLHFLERLHRLAPDDNVAVEGLGRLYAFLRARLDRAAKLAGLAHERARSEDTFRLHASIAWARADKAATLDWLRRGLEAYPESKALLELRGKVEGVTDDSDDAGDGLPPPAGDGSGAG